MSNFRPPTSEGHLGTPYVRYDPDDLRAAQENHERMLNRTRQTQEQYEAALQTMYDLTKKQYEREGPFFFRGCAARLEEVVTLPKKILYAVSSGNGKPVKPKRKHKK